MLRRIIANIAQRFENSSIKAAMSEAMQAGDKRPADDLPVNEASSDKKAKEDSTEQKPARVKRKKIALLTVYSGKGYHGVQLQITGVPTIEGEMVKALLKSNLIEQAHADDVSKMWFQRASRTDKGVSAAGQVFSFLMSINILTDIDKPVELLNSQLPPVIRVVGIKKTTKMFDAKNNCSYRTYEYLTPTYAFAPIEEKTTESYRISDEVVENVNSVMQNFKGTKNFHNFTSRRKHHDKSSTRYMMSFEAGKPFIMDGVEFLVITVRGQSFMLHQIRKMIGLTMAVVKGYASQDTIELCWGPNKVDIPKAPGLGLLLDKLHYDGYNKRFGSDGMHEAIDWDLYKEEIEKFKMDQIYADIIRTEKEENSMLQWLRTLNLHSYQMYIDPPPTAIDSDDEVGPKANSRARINMNENGIPIDKDGIPLDTDGKQPSSGKPDAVPADISDANQKNHAHVSLVSKVTCSADLDPKLDSDTKAGCNSPHAEVPKTSQETEPTSEANTG